MKESLFNDLIQGLNEAIAHERVEMLLKVTTHSADDFMSIYSRLPEEKKVILLSIANDMLIANVKA